MRDCYRKYGTQYAARLLGRSLGAITARASILGLTDRSLSAGKPRPWARKGWSPPPWTATDDEQLRRLHADGYTPRQIADAMGRTKVDVRQRARAIGVYRDLRPWSEEDDRMLRELYGTMPYAQVAERLGRSVASVTGHAAFLGIAHSRTWEPWEPKEDKLLRSLYGQMPNVEVARRMNRSEDAVIIRAGKLGLTRGITPPWSTKEDALLKQLHRAGTSYDDIARAIGRTRNAVSGRVMKLGLVATQPMRAPRWTKQEENVLRKLYGMVRNREIAARLGRTLASVGLKARELGLAGPPSQPWSASDDRYIKRRYGTASREEIATALGRTVPAVASRAEFLGMTRRRAKS